jgi:hypothetical protein
MASFKDFTFLCDAPEEWAVYRLTLPVDASVDEIGYIPTNGLLVADSKVKAQRWNVNVRYSGTEEEYVAIAKGDAAVVWVSPDMILNPIREWAGGMDYYTPTIRASKRKR